MMKERLKCLDAKLGKGSTQQGGISKPFSDLNTHSLHHINGYILSTNVSKQHSICKRSNSS